MKAVVIRGKFDDFIGFYNCVMGDRREMFVTVKRNNQFCLLSALANR